MTIHPGSRLAGRTVGQIEGDLNVSVVLLRRDGASDPHPAADQVIAAHDVIAVLGEPHHIARLTGESL